jgi:hypothetical protein
LFCPREIFKGGDGLLAAEVDNQQMGHNGRTFRLPISAFLEIEDFVARVVAIIVLAIGILCGPRFA